MSFSQKILLWYAENKRDLPWRSTRDPYKIWLSEIMLQQTRVAQGTPYYLKFLENFPTVKDLANAPEEKVLKLWQGLGYYSRARNLHTTAKIVTDRYKGKFPNTYKELVALKGVGDYTASAIASICFNKAEPVVDGNVYRVLSRYFGVDIPINGTEGVKYFKQLAKKVMDTSEVRDYNQGIMEFGAIQCTPKKPYCLHCPLNDSCVALQKNTINSLPVKLNKTKIRNRYFNYLVPVISNEHLGKEKVNYSTLLHKRNGKGIWQGLFEFPLLESEEEIGLKEVKTRLKEFLDLKDMGKVYQHNEETIVHKLSHQHLHTKFWIVRTHTSFKDSIDLASLHTYPVPVLIADFIKTFKI
ncbi:MAG: A/G-specific adenine glycosylase [Bacteroidota bacterium]